MGQFYTASFQAIAAAATTPLDLFQLVPPSDAVVILHSAFIGQSSDAGDAEAEMLDINISTSNLTVNGSGGPGAVTPHPHERGFGAAGSVVEVVNDTLSTVQVIIQPHVFNVQAGWFYQPTPEERLVFNDPTATTGNALIINMPVGPADELTIRGFIVFEEIGG